MVKEKENDSIDTSNIFLSYMSKVLDECEKKDNINNVIDSGFCLSTGLLTFDLVMNGGIRSGWTTSLGMEQSGKSSIAIKILGSLAKKNIPGYFIDAEGSLNTEYACAIAGIKSFEEYFGRKSPTGKGYEIIPKIRYTPENGLEKVFRFMQRILLRLPDKMYRQADDCWYYVFSKEKEDVELMKSLGLKHDAKLYSETGRFWCKAPNSDFQVVFIVDSLPGLVPENIAQDADEKGKAMALEARALSKAAKPVRGLIRRKHAVLLMINQQRQAPGVMFGPSEYEPCGNYVKFACIDENSYIFSEKGMEKIKEYLEGKVLGEKGLEQPNAHKNFGKKACVELFSNYGYSLVGSHSHRLRCIKLLEGVTFPKMEWRELKNLSSDYFIPIKYGANVWGTTIDLNFIPRELEGRGKKFQKNSEFPTKMSKPLARILGYLLSDGHTRGINVSFINKDLEILENFKKDCELLNFEYSEKIADNGVHYIHIVSPWLWRFLTHIGVSNKPSRWKSIPDCILQAPKEYVIEFLKALMDGDGIIGKEGNELGIALTSREMIDQIHLLLLNFGIISKKKYTGTLQWYAENEIKKRVDSIYVSGNMIKKYSEEIGFICRRKRERLEDGIKKMSKRPLCPYVFPDIITYKLKGRRIYHKIFGTYVNKEGFSESFKDIDMRDIINKETLYLEYIKTLKTKQERDASLSLLNDILDFCRYSLDNNIHWQKINKIEDTYERVVYDFNMPETHTVITNGFVSHNSDVRNELLTRSVPDWFEKGKLETGSDTKTFGGESSVEGNGTDIYSYKMIKNIKNKNGVPYRRGYVRIWNSDYQGKCRGFCPVFDTLKYLESTKQVGLKKVNGRREISGLNKFFPQLKEKENIQYEDFKRFILWEVTRKESLLKEFLKNTGLDYPDLEKIPHIREICEKQMESGESFELLLVKDGETVNLVDILEDEFEELGNQNPESKESLLELEDYE